MVDRGGSMIPTEITAGRRDTASVDTAEAGPFQFLSSSSTLRAVRCLHTHLSSCIFPVKMRRCAIEESQECVVDQTPHRLATRGLNAPHDTLIRLEVQWVVARIC